MKSERKKKTIIITSLLVLVICLGIGFAAFSTTLKINGRAKVVPDAKNFKVVFANSKSGSDYSYADIEATTNPDGLNTEDGVIDNNEVPTVSGMHVTFTEDNQSATYDFLVANIGKYDAYLTNIVFGTKTCSPGEGADPALVSEACKAIKMEFILGSGDSQQTFTNTSSISEHILEKGNYEPVKVVISYPEGAQLPDGDMDIEFGEMSLIYTTVDDNIEFNTTSVREVLAEKGPNYIMKREITTYKPSNRHSFFKASVGAESIDHIYILPYIDIPDNAIKVEDISRDQDGSVMLWEPMPDIEHLLNPDYDIYIAADGLISVEDASNLFAYLENVEVIDLSYLDTSEATDMGNMFYHDIELTNLNLSNLDTSNVTNMAGMFAGCGSLKSLDLKGFKTGNVTNMYDMFSHCSQLTSLDLSSFDTSKVQTMDYMFEDCYELKDLLLTSFDTSSVTTMSSMFSSCAALEEIDLSSFDTSNVTDMTAMFQFSGVKNLDLSSFHTGKLAETASMFSDCTNLETLDFSNLVSTSLTSVSWMFMNNPSLVSVDLRSFDINDVSYLAFNEYDFGLNKHIILKDTQTNRDYVRDILTDFVDVEWI